MSYTDIHAHIIYGVDDGPKSYEEMTALLDAAFEDGIRHLYATSHQTPGIHRFDNQKYESHMEEARAYCRLKGYDLQLIPGAELLYTPAMDGAIAGRRIACMGDTRFALIEFVPDIRRDEMDHAVELLVQYGYFPILAHIERYRNMTGSYAKALKEDIPDIRYQVNGHSLEQGGFFQKKRLQSLIKSGLVDYVASDMHNTLTRPPNLRKTAAILRQICNEDEAIKLLGGL